MPCLRVAADLDIFNLVNPGCITAQEIARVSGADKDLIGTTCPGLRTPTDINSPYHAYLERGRHLQTGGRGDVQSDASVELLLPNTNP